MNKRAIEIGALLGLIALGLFLVLRGCDKKEKEVITNEQLKPREREAIILNPNTGEVKEIRRIITKEGKPSTSEETITGAREIRVSIDPEGNTTVIAKTKGFECRPGFSVGYAETYRLGLDVELAYWKQWGVMAGISTNMYDGRPRLALYGGADWRLPWHITRNTSLFISYDTRKSIYFGIRAEL